MKPYRLQVIVLMALTLGPALLAVAAAIILPILQALFR
jgi:hypothetical protein